MSSSKKIDCKETLRQVFIRVYWLEMQSVVLVISNQLCKLLPLSPSLWFKSPPSPLPYVKTEKVYCFVCTSTVCKRGGGYGVLGLRQKNTCHKVPLQVNCFRWRHFALPSMSLIFQRPPPPSRHFPYKKQFYNPDSENTRPVGDPYKDVTAAKPL